MKKQMILSLALLIPVAAFAQGWTLQQCIDHAIENNITVRQQEITVQQSEVELNTSQNSRLPAVSASASENFSFGRGLTSDNTYLNTNTTSTSFSLGAEVPLFQGFQIKQDVAARKLDLSAATADLENIRDNIMVNVAQTYVQILYDMEILEAAADQAATDSLQLLRLEEMEKQGKASSSEVAQQRSAFSQSVLSRVQARNSLMLDILDLTQLLELPSPEGFSVVRPSDATLEPSLLESPESIYETAVDRKASVQAEETRLAADSVNVRLAKSYLYPTLSLSGGIGTDYYTASSTAYSSFSDQMKNNFSQYIGLTLTVPIFSRFQYRNNIRTAELNRRSQVLQVETARKSLYKEIQQAYYNAVSAQSQYLSSISAASSAEESFELVKARYESGKANVTEYNEARTALFKASSDLAQARYQSLYQTALLGFYKDGKIVF